MDTLGTTVFVHCSEVVPSLEVDINGKYFIGSGVSSLSIVKRLSALQSLSEVPLYLVKFIQSKNYVRTSKCCLRLFLVELSPPKKIYIPRPGQ